MKNDHNFSRRNFLKKSATLASAYPFITQSMALPLDNDNDPVDGVKVNWLTKPLTGAFQGATCGVCWPRGKVKAQSHFTATDPNNNAVAVQNWPLAYWPDGSLKWTGHAFPAASATATHLVIKPSRATGVTNGLQVSETADQITVHTGAMQCVFQKRGTVLVHSIIRQQKEIAVNGKLVVLLQDQPDDADTNQIRKERFHGEITEIAVEQRGPVRAVIRVKGRHRSTGTSATLIPFVIRFYLYHESEAIRILHTILYDGEENKHYIKGIGISFDVPLNDELYNRHIRFVNAEFDGVFAESVQGLTGLRRDPGEEVRRNQINGDAALPAGDFPDAVGKRLQYIPAFGDYTLFQGNASSFTIRKRTGSGHTWLTAAEGRRAAGVVYLGTPAGGLAAGIRNFWESHPAQLDVRAANQDTASVTLWIWAPDSPAMDLRFYHDGMGQDTFPRQREGLEITYEDYEPGFGTPTGVARTSEIMLWATNRTPSRKSLLDLAASLQTPATLICDRVHLEQQKVFGGNWTAQIDKSIPAKAQIEKSLDRYFEYYQQQIEHHKWYGFWNYGDFMHTYDADRHVWRYDVGGFAWDNSELSTDLWLWYYFLHTGRADAFRVAEAMTRHTGEVDVHHFGPFAPLGSRHNVLHWGCSAKQLRISTAANRRIYYYLTTDERTGELLEEQVNAVAKLAEIVPGRKLSNGMDTQRQTHSGVQVGFGTDWGAVAAAWLTRWERTNDPGIKQKLLNSMRTIAAQPKGFFTGGGAMDLETGKFSITKDERIHVSHLSAVFGLTEICEELVLLLNEPGFTKAWLQYCRLYNAPPEEQQKELGERAQKLNLQQGHARLTAFAASHLNDPALARRAWQEFYEGRSGLSAQRTDVTTIKGPQVLYPVTEDLSVSTNAVAQWGLAALQCLAYVGQHIPQE